MATAHAMDSKAQRLLAAGLLPYKILTGTTSGTANTAATLAHGWQDKNGNTITPDYVIAMATGAGANPVYQSAVPTASVIDIRSNGLSIPYVAVCLAL